MAGSKVAQLTRLGLSQMPTGRFFSPQPDEGSTRLLKDSRKKTTTNVFNECEYAFLTYKICKVHVVCLQLIHAVWLVQAIK